MGPAYSSNTLNDTIDELNEAITSVTTSCQTTLNQLEQLNIKNVHGLNIGAINMDEIGTISMSCISDSKTQQNIQASLNTQITQIAKTVNQSLNLAGTTEASNTTALFTQLKDVVYNSFVETCSAAITQSEIVNIEDSSDVYIPIMNFKESANNVLNCTQNDQAVSDMKTQITQQISQTATATVESFLTQIFLILLMVVIIIGFLMFGSILKIVIIVVLLVGLNLLLAWLLSWTPFKRAPPNVIIAVTLAGGAQPTTPPRHLPTNTTPYIRGSLPTITASITSGLPTAEFARFELVDLAQAGNVVAQSTANPWTYDTNALNLTPGQHNLIVRAVNTKGKTFQAPLLAWYVTPPYIIILTGPGAAISGTQTSVPACPSDSKITPHRAKVTITGNVAGASSASPSPAGGTVAISFSQKQATPACAPAIADLTNVPVDSNGNFSVDATDIQKSGFVYSGAYNFNVSFFPPGASPGSAPVAISDSYTFTVCTGTCVTPSI